PLGQVGHVLAHIKANGTTHVALAGHLSKPSILSLKPDATGLKLLARAVIRHDDALLRAVTGFLQENGFQLITAQDLIPGLLAPKGLLSKAKPTADEEEDIALARSTLAVLGDLDIGQACIVHNGAILGVEAVEGTDTLIARCSTYRAGKGEKTDGGILVKRAKDMQTDLADLPTVGPDTFRQLATHGYRGICIQANRTILLGKEECIALANQHNLFLLSE
ncbi:MAG: LpxI family protein, partial [Alphaproteobacteria bacterium]